MKSNQPKLALKILAPVRLQAVVTTGDYLQGFHLRKGDVMDEKEQERGNIMENKITDEQMGEEKKDTEASEEMK